jgi:hypothetical protein
MNEKLAEINKQLEALSVLINEFLNSNREERIILTKKDFGNIRHIAIININTKNNWHILDYNNGCIFKLHSSNNNDYESDQFTKLFNGILERLILIKKEKEVVNGEYTINYELEPYVRTKLFDLYGDNSDENDIKEVEIKSMDK